MAIPSPVAWAPTPTKAPARESRVAGALRALWESLVGLARAPRYTVPAVLSLALGLGAATAVFAVFSALVLRPLPFPDEDRLVRVGYAGASPVLPPEDLGLSAPFLRDLQKLGSIFDEVATERSWTGRLEVGGRSLRVGPQLVSTSFFDTLGIQALKGRLFSGHGPEPDGLDVMVVREGFWRNQLGAAPIVGQTVRYEGHPVKVLGILRDDQAIPSSMDLWIPEDQADQTQPLRIMARGLARLAPNLSLETAQTRLDEALAGAGVRTLDGTPVSARLIPLRDSLVQPQRALLALMFVAVLAFLLLAAANLAALLATRSSARSHEWAVRRALGSNALALARSSALDAALMGSAGAGLGLWLAQLAIEFANQTYRDYLGNTPARLDGRVLIACGVATVLCALAGALAPLLSLRRVTPADALRGEGRSTDTPRARRLRELLLVIQVAVSTVLLINAGLVVRSVRSLLAIDSGFDRHDVLTMNLLLPFEPIAPTLDPAARQQAFLQRNDQVLASARAALERLRRMPGAEHATVTIDVPFDYLSRAARLALPPGARQAELTAFTHFVGPDYFETLGTRLISGRDFGKELVDEPHDVAVVSRAFARALGVEDAVGQRFRVAPPVPAPPQPWIEIVGMVDDSIENDLTAAPPAQVYLPFSQGALSVSAPTMVTFQVAVRGSDPDALARELPPALGEALPQATLGELRRMDEWVADSFWQRTALSRILSGLAIASAVLSAIGLFGITSFAVTQRTGEVGIRRALGATRGAVVALVLRGVARVVGLGLVIGALLSWLSRELLASFLYGVGALDPLTYVEVALGVGAVALLSALAPAFSAARVSPVHALSQ